MQTFLPYPSFEYTARVLDMRRLGKQRVECKQILLACGVSVGSSIKANSGWAHHPAVRMWKGHEVALAAYAGTLCVEWKRRGYKDTLLEQFADVCANLSFMGCSRDMPRWLGNQLFHLAHRSNLIRKLPEHYRPFWPDVPDDLPYVWPV